MFWELIGGVAATLTMFSFVPQIIKSLRTHSVKDISPVTLLQLAAGVTLWIVYGIHLRNPIIIVANAVTLSTMIVLLSFYFFWKK